MPLYALACRQTVQYVSSSRSCPDNLGLSPGMPFLSSQQATVIVFTLSK